MSLTIPPLAVLLLLKEHGLLEEVGAVCDFGSQEFDARESANNKPYETFFAAHDIPVPSEFYDLETGRLYGTSGDLFRALGKDYRSFDIDGRWGSRVLDLNMDEIPQEDRGRYSLTMNIGTSEHVFNQHNFFLQSHNVTAEGGLMFHLVPCNNYMNHGLYCYSPTFFISMAEYNQYELLGLWHWGKLKKKKPKGKKPKGDKPKGEKPKVLEFRSGHEKTLGGRAVLIAVMRKTRADDFVMPLQVNEPMILSAEAEERYGTFRPQQLVNFNTTGVLPSNFYLDIETGRVHERQVQTEG